MLLDTPFLRIDLSGRKGGEPCVEGQPAGKSGWESASSVGAHAGEGLRFHTLRHKLVQRVSACDHC